MCAAHDDHAATGRRKSAVDVIEQPRFQPLLQRDNSATERRLMHPQNLRRGRHGLVLSQRQDMAQIIPIDVLGGHRRL